MKIIQSYWSLPALSQENDKYGRSNGGYIDSRFHHMSWALSCLTLKRFYNEVELITDKKGKELLIDTLKLPYTKVTICLDELNGYDPKLWAMGKIKAYQLQKEPFLHVDGDIFIWKAFGDKVFEQNPLIVQNMEVGYSCYTEQLSEMKPHFSYIPKDIINSFSEEESLTAINAGIIGGTDIDFFQEYTAEALRFICKNLQHLHKINVGRFNIIFEQHLFYAMASNNQKRIYPFLNLEPYDDMLEVTPFHLLPNIKSFVHLISMGKISRYAYEQVEMRLKYEFPEYHRAISNLFDNSSSEIDQRYRKLQPLFDFMQVATPEKILETPLQLSSHAKIIEGSDFNLLEFTQPYSKRVQKVELKDWDVLLETFENPTSGKEVLDVITQNVAPELHGRIKNNLIKFLTDKLIYDDILEIV